MRDDNTNLGRVIHRSDDRRFGIRQEDRFLHLYVLGKTGTGKSTCLATWQCRTSVLGEALR